MYKYTLYNDDCIIDTTNNLLIYRGDSKWNEFESWKNDNPSEHESILIKKEKTLRWNGGYPRIIDGCEYQYDDSGSLMEIRCENYTEYYHDDDILYKRVFHENGKEIKTIEINEKDEIWRTTDHQIKYTIQYDTVQNIIDNTTKYHGEFSQKVLYNANTPLHCKLFKNDILLKETKYFPKSNKIKSILKRDGEIFQYIEYYLDSGVRTKGTLDSDRVMDGVWIFYHQNGNIESKYLFKKGEVEITTFYNELGETYKELEL